MPSLSFSLGFVAAGDGIDLVACGFEIVAQQQRQRLLVLDDQDAGDLIRSAPSFTAQRPASAKAVVSPFGRSSVIGRPSIM